MIGRVTSVTMLPATEGRREAKYLRNSWSRRTDVESRALTSGVSRQAGGHPGRQRAGALDQVLDAGAAELTQGRPDREAAGAARGVEDQVAEGEVVAAR